MSSNHKPELNNWRVGIFPGLAILILTIASRLVGGLQLQEWLAFDSFLKSRSVIASFSEPIDPRITIIAIDEEDIAEKGYPIPDSDIANLLLKLQEYQPQAVGLDLAKNLAEPELVTALKANSNQFAVAKILPPKIAPPPGLAPEQIGFIDIYTDGDSRLRRVLLGINHQNYADYQKSLIIRLVEKYFANRGIKLENGKRDRYALTFDGVELPRFFSRTGGYVGAESNGEQMLINFRSGKEPFRILSLKDLETNNFEPSWLQDRIILIGMTAPSVGDIQSTAAISYQQLSAGKIYGVEVIAHAVSQIISAVEDDRPLIKTWSEPFEYLWIVVWGIAGIGLAWLPISPWKNLVTVIIAVTGQIVICYLLLIYSGWWLPVVPAGIVCLLNGIVLHSFYYHDRNLRYRLQERQATIDLTYDSIHNGPLQTLKMLIRKTKDNDLTLDRTLTELETLDTEMREVYESLYRETSNPVNCDRSIAGVNLDMKQPLHELLEQVYRHTTARMTNQQFPYFTALKVLIPDFQPLDDRFLKLEQKMAICRVLEEALCNVGKYAEGATRLKVSCQQQENNLCVLRIEDNGIGCHSQREGRGTKQARNIARKLKGKFERKTRVSKKGTVCELTWQNKRTWF